MIKVELKKKSEITNEDRESADTVFIIQCDNDDEEILGLVNDFLLDTDDEIEAQESYFDYTTMLLEIGEEESPLSVMEIELSIHHYVMKKTDTRLYRALFPYDWE